MFLAWTLIATGGTMPKWFGMPGNADLPSTFRIEYVMV